MMKILITTADHLMIDRRILQEAESLASRGHEVTLLAGFKCAKYENFIYNGIKIKRFFYDYHESVLTKFAQKLKINLNFKQYWILFKLYRIINRIINRVIFNITSFDSFILKQMMHEEADIIHVHDFPMLKTGLIFAKKRGIKLIYDAHELYYSQIQLPSKVQKKYKKQEGKLIKNASSVITVNPYIANLMAKRYKIIHPNVIMNALPLKPKVDNKRLRTRFNLPDDAKIVLYQGWISANRGIEKIVEAARYFHDDIYLVLIGYGDFVKVIEEMIDRYDLNNKIFLYGEVLSEMMHELTCEADLGIIPYHGVDENNYYCSPNKLFEFAVAGIPFISNDLPFLRDMIEKYKFGEVCDLNDFTKTAQTINEILTSESRINKLKENAIDASLELNWKQEEKKLFNIYDDFINNE